jgi:signal transduction histidine kinase
MLGSIPVRLAAECPALAAGSLMTPARTALATMWLAAIGAIIASATTLRASIAYGERRSRFASSVTHELRTPLTTFRMYSEMLAQGMVRDEQQRAVYLNTLQSESARLTTLVENVLSYARLEQGRARSSPQAMTVDALIERVVPDLERRASSCGMSLVVNAEDGKRSLCVDADAIGQILFNLVDNACKYANSGDSVDRVIEVDCRIRDAQLEFVVKDEGPGIAPEHAKTIFKPFERGAHQPGDATPGVGLGLALARGLAREMGGDLVLLSPAAAGSRRGAAFRLVLPGT